jgi:hypothetical protein
MYTSTPTVQLMMAESTMEIVPADRSREASRAVWQETKWQCWMVVACE